MGRNEDIAVGVVLALSIAIISARFFAKSVVLELESIPGFASILRGCLLALACLGRDDIMLKRWFSVFVIIMLSGLLLLLTLDWLSRVIFVLAPAAVFGVVAPVTLLLRLMLLY